MIASITTYYCLFVVLIVVLHGLGLGDIILEFGLLASLLVSKRLMHCPRTAEPRHSANTLLAG